MPLTEVDRSVTRVEIVTPESVRKFKSDFRAKTSMAPLLFTFEKYLLIKQNISVPIILDACRLP